jgi:transcriptional regulator with XRE-family HTH domain
MQRRRLASELRRLRAASQRTLEEVADYLECSPAKVSRIENGQVAVRIQDAKELLDLYGVDDERRAAMLHLVRQARRKGWWSGYADILEEGTESLLSLEDEAAAILIYETNLVTGLLQTRSYAWELMSSWNDVPLDAVERRVDLRMARQQILDRPDPPDLTVILDESSLRHVVGEADVMREQYRRLAEDSDRANVTVRVLPFAAGTHQAMGFPFHIFEFVGDDPRVVYVELLDRSQFLEDANEIGRYLAAFAQVRERALSPEDSHQLLKDLADAQ